jgi:hypothetical protein
LGIDLSGTGLNVDALETSIKNLGNASSKLTFEEMTKELNSFFAIKESLVGKTGTLKFSEEDKTNLINAGIAIEKDFFANPLNQNEWIYRGNLTSTEIAR